MLQSERQTPSNKENHDVELSQEKAKEKEWEEGSMEDQTWGEGILTWAR